MKYDNGRVAATTTTTTMEEETNLVKNLEGALKANINILLSSSMKLNNTNEGSNSLTGE